jgi:hypothetical protein
MLLVPFYFLMFTGLMSKLVATVCLREFFGFILWVVLGSYTYRV